MARILADTSAIYALFDQEDTNHSKAVALLRRLRGLDTFRFSATSSLLNVMACCAEDEVRARDVLRRDEDKDFSYVAATSFAVMERLRIREVFAFDPHFVQYRLRLFG